MFIFSSAGFLSACGDLGIRRGNSSPGLRVIDLDSATISNSSAMSVGADYAELLASGTEDLGCVVGAENNSTSTTATSEWTILDDTDFIRAALVTFATRVKLQSLALRLRLEGSPGATYVTELRTTTSGFPVSTILNLLASNTFGSASVSSSASGALKSFSLTTATWMDAGSYSLTLRGSDLTGASGLRGMDEFCRHGLFEFQPVPVF